MGTRSSAMFLPVLPVATTYATFVVANGLSNHILFPGLKLDYGILNPVMGRPKQQDFWGTRLCHVLGIAAPLAIADHASIRLWQKHLMPAFGYAKGTPLTLSAAPAAMLAHGPIWAFVGIMGYVAAEAYLSPLYTDPPMEVIKSKTYGEVRGVQALYMVPLVAAAVSAVAKRPAAHGTVIGLIAPTITFVWVKGLAMTWPWSANLTPFEKELNGIETPQTQ